MLGEEDPTRLMRETHYTERRTNIATILLISIVKFGLGYLLCTISCCWVAPHLPSQISVIDRV